jgi:acetolactate synthase-1/2/3 large subunit
MGDAAIGMVGMDLETAVRNKIGIITLIFNNGVMAGERSSMPKTVETHKTLDLGGNYAMVAKGLGEWSKRIDDPDDFIPTLKEAVDVTKSGAPALIECVAKENYKVSRY